MYYDVTSLMSMSIADMLIKISTQIIAAGGEPYLVGGVVRDIVLGKQVGDIDVEVHGLSLDSLEGVLAQFGHVRLVGRQFGVLRVDGLDIDWSLPRRDSIGRKPVVEVDPHMSLKQACLRRDVTMNALMMPLKELVSNAHDEWHKGAVQVPVLDFYGGLKDIAEKKLRATDPERFCDDPLRFYRVMQFVGRFEMQPDDHLLELCKKIDLTKIARERIYDEFVKLFCLAKHPSMGIRWLKAIDRLQEIMPEVAALIGVHQRVDYHPEGDVFEHTMQALDAAAQLDLDLFESNAQRLRIMWAALCHDLGKAVTTDSQGSAYNHEIAGVEIAQRLMKRYTDDVELIHAIEKLVRYHLAPGQLLDGNAGLKAYKRLAARLSPNVTVLELGMLALCDMRARNPHEHTPLSGFDEPIEQFCRKVEEAAVAQGPEPAVLKGRDLLDVVQEGPLLGKLVKRAYEIQIEEEIRDKNELRRRVLDER